MYSPLLGEGGGDDQHAPAFVYDPVFSGVAENTQRRRHDSVFTALSVLRMIPDILSYCFIILES
jgi:hypothetical protein